MLIRIAFMVLMFTAVANAEAKWKIIEDTAKAHFKRSIVIEISEPVDAANLTRIANSIKTDGYVRTFIEYYLPGMKINAGAWATSHFDPDLEVIIVPPEQIVFRSGSWETGRAEILIQKDSAGIFMTQHFKDPLAASETEDLRGPAPFKPGVKYSYGREGAGLYIKVTESGDLELWKGGQIDEIARAVK